MCSAWPFPQAPWKTSCTTPRLRPVVARIHTVLRTQRVAHFDESGFYIGGQRHWLHSAGTAEWSYYAPHARRGRAAMDDIAILPQFHGTAVHDGLAAYWSYTHCQHSLCNVHHVRELNGLLENAPQPWMQRFKWLLFCLLYTSDAADE